MEEREGRRKRGRGGGEKTHSGCVMDPPGTQDSVLHQHGNRHWPHPPWDRRDPASHLGDLFVVHITREMVARFLGGVCNEGREKGRGKGREGR